MKLSRHLIAAAGLVAIVWGEAQAGGNGLLNAVAYASMPGDKAVAVRALDNSTESLALKAQFERELQARGYSVAKDAAMVLSFEVRDVVGAWTAGERRAFLELEARGGRVGGERASAKLNIFDSDRGGIFNKGRGDATSITTPSRYRLDATVDDARSGKRLWQAWAVADLRHADGPTLTRAMVPVVVENLGNTVKRQPFQLP